MRIVHVSHHYYPVMGGLERAIEGLCRELVKLGHEVHVITSKYGAEGRPSEEVTNGIYIHRIKSIRFRYPDLTLPLEYPDVIKSADVVHGHTQNSLFTVKIIEKAKALRVKTVMHFMAVEAFDDHPNPLIRILGRRYGAWMLSRAIKNSCVLLSRSLRDFEILRSKYGINTIYVPDGVDRMCIETPNIAEEFRERYGLQEQFVLYIGRLHRLKGIEILIKAMHIVAKELSDLKAVIIGPGHQKPYRELARKLGIENSVLFLGFVDERTKIAALDASLALVLPSISNYVEVYPMVITEAWARGKPVIASSVGGVPYRVKHMVNGLLVPPRDPCVLAEAIVKIASDKNLASKLGSEGKKTIYSWSEIANKIVDVYKKPCEW